MRTIKNIWRLNRFLYRKGMLFQFWHYYWLTKHSATLRTFDDWYLLLYCMDFEETYEGVEFWSRLITRAREEYNREKKGL